MCRLHRRYYAAVLAAFPESVTDDRLNVFGRRQLANVEILSLFHVGRTEEIVGPYELHDFFLFCLLRLGAGPAKTLFLAEHAFRGAYEPSTLRRWLRVFVTRFFEQQFKRSISPDGPKVGSVSLSPRGDWRMPSDASSAAWLAELDEPAPVSKTLKTRKSASRSK